MTREDDVNPKVQTPPSRQRIARGELGAQVMAGPLAQYLRLAEDEHEAGPSSRLNIMSLMRNGSGGSR